MEETFTSGNSMHKQGADKELISLPCRPMMRPPAAAGMVTLPLMSTESFRPPDERRIKYII